MNLTNLEEIQERISELMDLPKEKFEQIIK